MVERQQQHVPRIGQHLLHRLQPLEEGVELRVLGVGLVPQLVGRHVRLRAQWFEAILGISRVKVEEDTARARARELLSMVGLRRRYEAELAEEPGRAAFAELREMARTKHVTLVFAAHDTEHCNAVVLRELLARPA